MDTSATRLHDIAITYSLDPAMNHGSSEGGAGNFIVDLNWRDILHFSLELSSCSLLSCFLLLAINLLSSSTTCRGSPHWYDPTSQVPSRFTESSGDTLVPRIAHIAAHVH